MIPNDTKSQKNHETTWGSLQVGFVQYQEIKHLKKN